MPDKKFVLEWIRYATNDLFAARHLFNDVYPQQTEISAWHCQQCAEKALKAFLIACEIDPPKIHNLRTLCGLCLNIDSSFSELETVCEGLNPYGAASRYPGEIEVDEIIAKALIGRAQKVYDFCVEKINALSQEKEGEK